MMDFSMSDFDAEYLDPGASDDLDSALKHTAETSPTSGPAAEKQDEDGEEDLRNMAEDFSKIAERVSKAIPRRYQDSMPTIYVVPRDLAKGRKEDPYEPEVVCMGPLLDQTERAKPPRRKLESYKWCCLRKLLLFNNGKEDANWVPGVHEPLLRKWLDAVKDLEPRIRGSYSDISFGGSSDMLALMMLLDGSFLLHRIMVEYARIDEGKEEDNDDWTQVVGRCGIWGIVTRDLLLLKNQIPFFLLHKLLEFLDQPGAGDDILVKGGLRLLADLRPGSGSSSITCPNVHHLLHLFYISIIGNNSNLTTTTTATTKSRQWMPCAKELEEAGVTIKAKKTSSFLDVSFGRRRRICGGKVLEIAQMELYDYSEALFRNLIAFEQTYLHTAGHVTAYALFMDCLIKTPEDMRLLHRRGVLVSHMNGDRDVAATGFFGSVCAQAHIFSGRNYLQGLMDDVVSYQSSDWRRWRADLKRNYFSNPWVTTSLIAAFLILAMTVLQTFFTVYGYYKPHGGN